MNILLPTSQMSNIEHAAYIAANYDGPVPANVVLALLAERMLSAERNDLEERIDELEEENRRLKDQLEDYEFKRIANLENEYGD